MNIDWKERMEENARIRSRNRKLLVLSFFMYWGAIFVIAALLGSCGKDDRRKQNCTIRGEECHNESTVYVPVRGDQGPEGASGKSCTVVQTTSGAEISCSDGTHASVSNGQTGATGAAGDRGERGERGSEGNPGADGSDAILETYDVCGDYPGKIDEVLVRLSDRRLLVLFADNTAGNNPRLSILPPGTYRTSDGTNCSFTVTNTYDIINEHY